MHLGTTWSCFMDIAAALALTLCVCALQASAQQTLPSQLKALVLNLCLPEENLAARAVDPVITDTLSGIASQLIGGTCKSIPSVCESVFCACAEIGMTHECYTG